MDPVRVVLTGMIITLLLSSVSGALQLLFENETNGLLLWGSGTLIQMDWSGVQFSIGWILLVVARLIASPVSDPCRGVLVVLEKLIVKWNRSIWIIPVLYSLTTLIVTGLFIFFDTRTDQGWFPEWLLVQPEHGHAILQGLATSILTMTSITFSTIMVVLTIYTSQYSPRILQNFISNRRTLHVLSVFISTFLYCVVIFLFVKSGGSEQAVMISPSFAIVMAILSLGCFVYFIHHVTCSIDINHLIQQIATENVESIDQNQEEAKPTRKLLPAFSVDWSEREWKTLRKGEPVYVYARAKGYIQLLNKQEIIAYAQKHQLLIEIEHEVGHFITEEALLMTIWGDLADSLLEEQINRFVTVGTDRSTLQDLEFGLEKLADIALRAISPSTNDPNTARSCVFEMGHLLSLAAQMYPKPDLFLHPNGEPCLRIKQRDFWEILYYGFYQIVLYAKQDVSVLLSIFMALQQIAHKNDQPIRKNVYRFGEYVLDQADRSALHELDVTLLEERLGKLRDRLGEDIPPA